MPLVRVRFDASPPSFKPFPPQHEGIPLLPPIHVCLDTSRRGFPLVHAVSTTSPLFVSVLMPLEGDPPLVTPFQAQQQGIPLLPLVRVRFDDSRRIPPLVCIYFDTSRGRSPLVHTVSTLFASVLMPAEGDPPLVHAVSTTAGGDSPHSHPFPMPAGGGSPRSCPF